jgi:hypothetical protein
MKIQWQVTSAVRTVDLIVDPLLRPGPSALRAACIRRLSFFKPQLHEFQDTIKRRRRDDRPRDTCREDKNIAEVITR